MFVLGVETSCDETGVGIYHPGRGLLANQLYSQVKLHAPYGGVVPELASRDHIRRLLPLIKAALEEARLSRQELGGIAYTAGPGLVGALMVGATVARSLAYALRIPAVAIHHMEGHLLSPMLENPALRPPFLTLLISGGHTQLLEARALGVYRLLGETIDDAVGEAFDKVAKMLGLGYPGGPQIERLAAEGDPHRFKLPRPMADRPGLDFSFSGLKTAVLYLVHDLAPLDERTRADIAAAFQLAVAETLAIKCRRAIRQTGLKRLVAAGGVCANRTIRQHLKALCEEEGIELFLPSPAFCTDNGAMIAFAGYLRLASGERAPLAIEVKPRWSIETLSEIVLAPGGRGS